MNFWMKSSELFTLGVVSIEEADDYLTDKDEGFTDIVLSVNRA